MTTRPFVAVTSAVSITTALLFCMTLLIAQGVAAPLTSPHVLLPVASVPPPEPPPERLRKPLPPPPPVAPPRTRNTEHTGPVWPTPTIISPPGANGPPAPGGAFHMGDIDVQTLDDGPAVEIMPVKPIYPGRMISRGIEGSVIVSFSVDAAGRVINAVVTSSTHQGFEKAALDAIERFRFQPRMIDGVAVTTTSLSKQFSFNIEQ